MSSGDVNPGRSVTVDGGLIREIGTSTGGQTIDLKGAFLIPGLIDAHVHLVWEGQPDPVRHMLSDPAAVTAYRASRSLRTNLRNGVTTVRDVGGPHGIPVAAARAVREGMIEGASALAAGAPIVQTGGHVHVMSVEADGPDEVRKAVRGQLKAGADLIKIMASGGAYTEGESVHSPQLTPEEVRAAVEEAHRAHKRIAAHALNPEAIRIALEAGVDTIEHGALATDENLTLFAETSAHLVPTLSPYFVMASIGERLGVPAFAIEKSEQVMERYVGVMNDAYRARINVGLGTDGGSPSIPHSCVALEAWIWTSQCGIEPLEVLRAATAGAAAASGLEDRGAIAPGKRADLVAFRRNPLEDITELHHPAFVAQAGAPIADPQPVWSSDLIRTL